jgi:hypothetical protein
LLWTTQIAIAKAAKGLEFLHQAQFVLAWTQKTLWSPNLPMQKAPCLMGYLNILDNNRVRVGTTLENPGK